IYIKEQLDNHRTQMAEVRNQLLKIEKTGEMFERACVSFEVRFTPREVTENIQFGIFMLLMERDEEFEKYHNSSNGVFSFSFSPFNLTNTGNHICWMANKTVLPNGKHATKVEFNNEVITQDDMCDQSKYRVYIFVMPEVLCGEAWTNEVCINYK
ncbi:MAG: hypothetical protein KAK04_20780, partial [Cyclobacteriaceae bacterium]|nr:hypothetical protein [Cyclobacteriaceae bacterium]